MIVVKLGGSLFDYPKLSEWLKVLSEEGAGKVVIVPGGGPFADQVRDAQKRWKFNDQQAHKMALHAMDQFGLMLVGIAEDHDYGLIPASTKQEIHKILASKTTPIWLPSKSLGKNTEIPQNWTATSDSLSAWLAKNLKADQLILIKRTDIDAEITLSELEKEKIIDSSFSRFVSEAHFETSYMNASRYFSMVELLKNTW